MNTHSFPVLIRSAVLFAFLACSSVLSPAGTTAQVAVPLPVLTSVADSMSAPDAILVTGQGFTPGGDVFIAVHDPWGERSYETRWTTASQPVFDMLGHDDPMLGYRRGGLVVESFNHLCGQQVMVRAYDQATRSWSNVVDFAGSC
jgi:hypothetical protein